MRVIKFNRDLELTLVGQQKTKIIADKEYIFTEPFVREFEAVYSNKFFTSNMPLERMVDDSKRYKGQELKDESLFCFRSGGIGDLMAMMVAIRNLKEKYPNCKVAVGSTGIYRDLFENDPDILEFVSIPYPFDYVKNSHYFLEFQGLIENSYEARYINMYDLFLNAFGIAGLENKKKVPKLFINKEVDYDIDITIQGKDIKRPIVGIQLETSTVIRDYPPEYFKDLITLLNSYDINTIIIGEPSVTGKLVEPYSLCDEKKSFNFSEFCINIHHLVSVINHCDFIIGPDTSGLHIAGALGKPMVGIFGVIPSVLRITYFKNAIGIDCKTRCSPCFLTQNRPCRYSVDERGYSPCMFLATPHDVLETVIENILPLFGILKELPSIDTEDKHVDEKRAVVTLAIGEQAQDMLRIAKPSFKLYADRIGADLVIIENEKINVKYPNLEKFQIRNLFDEYDRIIYLDVDIIVHPKCPDLFELVPRNALGVVPDCNDGKWGNINRFKEIVMAQDMLGGVDWTSGYFNSGVMVLSKEHKDIFINPGDREKLNSQFRDQTLINYNFQKLWQGNSDIDVFVLDKKFNGMEINGFSTRFATPNKTNAFIMHFAYEGKDRLEAMREVFSSFNEFKMDVIKKKSYDSRRPLLFYDVGELGWSMYISAHINYLLDDEEFTNITICTKKAKFPLYDDRVNKLEFPESISEELARFVPEGHHMFDPEKGLRIKHDILGPIFNRAFNRYNVITEYDYFHRRRKFKKYKSSSEADIVVANLLQKKRSILIFPRYRHSKFASRNLPKEFYIKLCDRLCYVFRNHSIISIGAQNGAYVLDDFVEYDNFIDLTLWDDNQTLDIFISLCNSGRMDFAFGSQSALPKIALLLGVPTYMIGHEKERHEITENWMGTRTKFKKVRSTENGYQLAEEEWDNTIEDIIEFSGIEKPIVFDKKDTTDIDSGKVKEYFNGSPLLFYDVGELGWTQYLVAYIKKYRQENQWRKIIVTTTKSKFVFYADCCDELLEIPDQVRRGLNGYEPESGWLLNPNDRKDRLTHARLKRRFENAFPQCDIFNRHNEVKTVENFYYRPYIASNEARKVAKRITDNKRLIIVFPRYRPGIYATRNLPLDFYTKLVLKLHSDFENHKVVAIGSKNGAHTLSAHLDLEDRFEDLVTYNNDKTLDILVAICNLRLADFTVGPQSGVSKIALLGGIPSFMLGHERERHMVTENWAATKCEFIELEKGSNCYTIQGDKLDDAINKIIQFGGRVIGGDGNEDSI